MSRQSRSLGTSRSRLTTRVLLICAALAAVQALVSLAVFPVTPAIAAVAPPAYALIAAVHSVMPFLARILTRASWTATITAAVAGVLIWPFSAIGPLVVVALVAGAASFDLALLGTARPRSRRLLLGTVLAGVVLFVISLPVFSPDHLTPVILGATLVCRVLGETVALLAARALVAGLERAGSRVR